MDNVMLRADCTRCAALCCVAHAFDRSAEFAFDKAGGEPCRNITASFGCAIHDTLAQRGFGGCTLYDCHGAGQRVVQEMFAGRNWRDEPDLAEPMFEAFRIMRKVHDLLLLLHTAETLPLTPAQTSELHKLQTALLPQAGWSLESLRTFEQGPLRNAVAAFLSSLKPQVAADKDLRARVVIRAKRATG